MSKPVNRPQGDRFYSQKTMHELRIDEAITNSVCNREGISKTKIKVLKCRCGGECVGYYIDRHEPLFRMK